MIYPGPHGPLQRLGWCRSAPHLEMSDICPDSSGHRLPPKLSRKNMETPWKDDDWTKTGVFVNCLKMKTKYPTKNSRTPRCPQSWPHLGHLSFPLGRLGVAFRHLTDLGDLNLQLVLPVCLACFWQFQLPLVENGSTLTCFLLLSPTEHFLNNSTWVHPQKTSLKKVSTGRPCWLWTCQRPGSAETSRLVGPFPIRLAFFGRKNGDDKSCFFVNSVSNNVSLFKLLFKKNGVKKMNYMMLVTKMVLLLTSDWDQPSHPLRKRLRWQGRPKGQKHKNWRLEHGNFPEFATNKMLIRCKHEMVWHIVPMKFWDNDRWIG